MKALEKQKPNLSVAVTSTSAKVFVKPGMHFRPE